VPTFAQPIPWPEVVKRLPHARALAIVLALFAALASAVAHSKRRLQIIVLDHATDTVWGGIEPLNVAADWRNVEG
jgi:hypothetical protein